ncbi:uncharacterized protein LY79DRAFT_673067 [Colletotrichum navitas]|uniref:Uncharacterized protein n=1 Tax=Colletotrichum navitas TaxID=681940 RepID=A0AAD8PQV0_9PEZI|nr:uncharacterized protein LY79DRAFT_673067 [Colletotrichum navitas]KAK1574251.1 hypothetical protein LY79DRAFT_673067 [Colletotrichum navitas]
MGAHSEESVYKGHTGPNPPHKYSSHESKKKIAKRRSSKYTSQLPSDEPSAYLASFNNADITTSEEQGKARVEAKTERLLHQFYGN